MLETRSEGALRLVKKEIAIEDEAWSELWNRYGKKWQQHVHFLIEKDLFGTDLVYWAKEKPLNRKTCNSTWKY